MMKGIKEEPASLEVQMEDAEKAMGDFDAVMQEMLDEWHNPNLSDEARSILKGLIEGSIRELSNFQAKASEDIESSRREFPIAESPPPAEIPQPDAAGLFRPIKRHYFSTPDHSSASTSPAEQRADRRPGR